METASVSVSGVQELSKKLKEPKWLLEYRQRNAEIFLAKPLKKSMYLNLSKLEALLVPPTRPENFLPKKFSQSGAMVYSWSEALKLIPKKVLDVLSKESAPKDQFEAFNNAWFNSGFVIVIGEGAKGGEIVFEPSFSKEAVAKVLVIVENTQNETKIFERFKGKEKLLQNETIFLLDGCSVAFLRLHQNSKNCGALVYQQAILQKDSKLLNSNAWLDGKLLRSNTCNILAGQGSEVMHLDFALLDGECLFDINNTSMHIATDTQAYTEIKSVLAGKAKTVFDGMIKILPSGQRTNALLEAHSMLLSETASSNNIPGLEIEADDVKATHSASVVQILEEQIFYLETRGIKKDIAKQLIVTAFLESIILRLPKEFHQELFSVVEQKMANLSKVEKNA
ncbi:MAG: SufD family Fe-S cluster assembly protein [Candidatus Diapherotrites archaeon]|nr:SufD family Fe-S cluster assembly protein [Candidatus Diapherotrites archaeon]